MTTAPVVARTRDELAPARAALTDGDVAVVMTMGALHEGHARLIRTARERARHVIVTIFLNPLQFGPKEDLSRYPRTFDADLALCRRQGVDLVFAPTPDVVYPDGDPGVRVSAGPLGDVLEGASRPGHFDGVLTVVAKLMHLTGGTAFYFGQKDAQQLLLIRRMVRDLDFPVRVVSVPTVREDDGLAMSSRNTYLSEADREVALCLSRALAAGAAAAAEGPSAVRRAARAVIARRALRAPGLGSPPQTRNRQPPRASREDGRRRPFEVFINSKNMEHYAWTVALTRMISAVFRRGGDVSFVVEELKAVFDPRGGAWMNGKYIPSMLAAIGGVLENHMINIGFLEGEGLGLKEDPTANVVNLEAPRGPACPSCGSYDMRKVEGCLTCASCGHSKCA